MFEEVSKNRKFGDAKVSSQTQLEMSKKLTAEERMKLAEEILNTDDDDNILEMVMPNPVKKRNRSENTLQKLINYNIIIEEGICWESRQAYLDLLKDFSAKRIEGVSFRDKFLTLRSQNMGKTK